MDEAGLTPTTHVVDVACGRLTRPPRIDIEKRMRNDSPMMFLHSKVYGYGIDARIET
jgi:hypothetical protein